MATGWFDVSRTVGGTAPVLVSRCRHIDGKASLLFLIAGKVVAKREKHSDQVTSISIGAFMRRLISRYSHATNVQFSVLCRHRSTEKLDSSCQCGVVRSRCPHGLLAVGYGIESGTGSLGVQTALGVHVVAYVSRWCRVTLECTRLGCSIWLNTFSRSRASDGNTSQNVCPRPLGKFHADSK